MPKYCVGEAGDARRRRSRRPTSSSFAASKGAKKSTAFSEPSGWTCRRTTDSPRFAGGVLPGVGSRRRAAVAGAEQDACPGRRRSGRRPTARCRRRCRSAIGDPARLDCARGRDAEHPALPGRDVAVRAEGRVDDAVHQQQARALQLGRRRGRSAPGAFCARAARAATGKPAFSVPVSMSTASMYQRAGPERARRVGLVRQVGGVRRRVDHRRRGDADVRRQIAAADVGGVPGVPRFSGAGQRMRAGGRVEPVDLVVLGRDQQRAVGEQRLRVDLAVDAASTTAGRRCRR